MRCWRSLNRVEQELPEDELLQDELPVLLELPGGELLFEDELHELLEDELLEDELLEDELLEDELLLLLES